MAFSTKYMRFEGSDEYVTAGNVLGFERTDAFSISVWFRTTGIATACLVAKMGVGTAYPGYLFQIHDTGNLSFYLINNWGTNNALQVKTTQIFNDGAWHHAVVSYSGSSAASGVAIIVDGSTQSCTAVKDGLTASIATTATLNIGRRDGESLQPYTGSMDEVAIYNKALSLTEAQWIYNSGVPRDLTLAAAPSNLTAWWRMGETDSTATNGVIDNGPSPYVVGTAERDLSGNNYGGTRTNMESGDVMYDHPSSDTIPRSLAFDGASEHVSMGVCLPYERNQAYSFSAWVRTTVGGMILAKQYSGTPFGYGWWLWPNDMFFEMIYTWPGNLFSSHADRPNICDGAWHHVVMTYDGLQTASSCKFYCDGAPLTISSNTNTLSGNINNASAEFWVGMRHYDTQGMFVGNIDDVAAYDKELTQAEVTWIYNSGIPRSLTDSGCPPNLSGWWKMGDGDTYPTVVDHSSGGHPGTMANMEAVDFATETPGNPKYAVRCIQLDGSDEHVTMGDVLGTTIERNTTFSLSVWFKTTSTGDCALMARQVDGNPEGWDLEVNSGTNFTLSLVHTWSTNCLSVWASAGSSVADGQWHHLVVTHNGSGLASGVLFYCDGVLRTTNINYNNLATNIYKAGTAFTLGCRMISTSRQFFPGCLDDAAVYNRALTQAEVTWLYNSKNPRSLKGPAAPSGLVGWWRLGEGVYPGTMANMETADILLGGPGGIPGVELPLLFYSDGKEHNRKGVDLGMGGGGGPITTVYYKMRAQDSGASPPGYVTWIATASPDFAGAGYSGGSPTPVGTMVPDSAVVVAHWEEEA